MKNTLSGDLEIHRVDILFERDAAADLFRLKDFNLEY